MSRDVVKLLAVGDIFLGEHPYTLGHGVTSVAKQRGCDFLFAKTSDYLLQGDIVCGNLEGIISPKQENEKGIKTSIFWGESTCASAMKNAGFNCLFVANNHTAQHGVKALKQTCELLDKNDIKWAGYNPSAPDTPIPVIFDVKGIKVGILAYCETQQYHLDTKILPIIHVEQIKNDVKKLRQECDVIVVSLHWGDEFIDYPSPKQTQIAHDIIDSGVHLILGHHSHAMQGIEKYNDGLIVYSLGTFVKDLWRKELRESIILNCDLTSTGIKQFSIIPIFINEKYQPELYDGQDGKEFIERLNQLSEKIDNSKLRNSKDLQKEYLQEVDKLSKFDKFEIYKHYTRNIMRYDKKLLFENIILMLKRRIFRRNI